MTKIIKNENGERKYYIYGHRFQITCDVKEYDKIKKIAEKKGMTISNYCLSKFYEAIKSENIEKIDFVDLFNYVRETRKMVGERKRISIVAKTKEEYSMLQEKASELNVPLGTFIRYIALGN